MVILLSNEREQSERNTASNKGFCNSGADSNKHQLFFTINTSSSSTERCSSKALNFGIKQNQQQFGRDGTLFPHHRKALAVGGKAKRRHRT